MQRNAHYWGKQGEYGPFSTQADGWPHRGEIVRRYRKQKKLSAKKLGELYGNITEGRPLGERWIQKMESENLVPKDESKRRALGHILGIPFVLLGLGSLEDVQAQRNLNEQSNVTPQVLKHIDFRQYDTFLDLYWTLDYTSTARQSLRDIEKFITDLRSFVPHIKGSEQIHVYELLCGFYPLASTIYSDQRNYPKALEHAENGFTLATTLENNRLKALALYQRGFVKLQQAIASDNHGNVNQRLLNDVIDDFEAARPLASPQVEASLLLDYSWARSLKKGNNEATKARQYIDLAEIIVGRNRHTDGTFLDTYANIDKGKVALSRAITLIGIGHYEDAGYELEHAENLISHDQTRRRAYIEMLWARTHIGQREYVIAIEHALNATNMSKSIHSLSTLSMLRTIHSQLQESSYGSSKSVTELGVSLILP